ncbi:MAG: exodeoxyribonuclease VII large subunit [Alkalispirochaetaceae bacterium]
MNGVVPSKGNMEGQPTLYTVTELTSLLKATLEESFPLVRLEGELSNFKIAGSGHWYFSLRDESAIIQGVMFRGDNRGVEFAPRDGDKVEVIGPVTVYPRQGRYQILCRSMRSAGLGALLARLEERKRRLAAEGLFEEERKVPIPSLPRTVGVITSPTGAAIRDILNVLHRRNAGIRVILFPAAVQGREAPRELAAQVRRADRLGLVDVLILGRGGGSLEDLLAFSEEEVVRAVAECKTPIISAVGHEVDQALTDLAADRRAPTPSAAAELVTANIEELRRRVLSHGRAIVHAFTAKHRQVRALLDRFSSRELGYAFRAIIQPAYQRLDDAKEELLRTMDERLAEGRRRLELAEARIAGANPYDILRRGYAIVRSRAEGRVLPETGAVRRAQELTIQMRDGSIDARVTEEQP